MKYIIKIITVIGLIILMHNQIYAKATFIPVDSIFNATTSITEIRITGYIGDSLMTYIDLESMDTLQLYCNGKVDRESLIDSMKEKYPDYNSWEGSFPRVGESIIMITYHYNHYRILFARKIDGYYRFWDPNSRSFANSVFFINKEGIYKPTEFCTEDFQSYVNIRGPFLMPQDFFEEIKSKTNDEIFQKDYPIIKGLYCSDGFLIEENEFEKMKDKN